MVMNVAKISQKMKNKNLFSTEKKLQNEKKRLIIKNNDFKKRMHVKEILIKLNVCLFGKR